MKPFRYLEYLKKHKGGRLENVATFLSACQRKGNSNWIIEKTIQSADDANDEFAHVGISKLIENQVIIKIMNNGLRAQREKKILEYFRNNPHQNIVQGIYVFECKDNPIRWNKSIKTSQPICLKDGISSFIIIIQEYIKLGSIADNDITKFKKSIILQLIYATLEWYDIHKFIYQDWHKWNILLDTTTDKTRTYNAFGKKWVIQDTMGYSPVLTDFARSNIKKHLEPYELADQIALILDIFNVDQEIAIAIGSCENIKDILNYIKIVSKKL